MLQAPTEFGDWPAVWTEVLRTRAHEWNTGRLTERELFSELAARSGMAVRSIEGASYHFRGDSMFSADWPGILG